MSQSLKLCSTKCAGTDWCCGQGSFSNEIKASRLHITEKYRAPEKPLKGAWTLFRESPSVTQFCVQKLVEGCPTAVSKPISTVWKPQKEERELRRDPGRKNCAQQFVERVRIGSLDTPLEPPTLKSVETRERASRVQFCAGQWEPRPAANQNGSTAQINCG